MFLLQLCVVRMPGADEIVVDEIVERLLCHESDIAGYAFKDFEFSIVAVFPHGLFCKMQTVCKIIEMDYALSFVDVGGALTLSSLLARASVIAMCAMSAVLKFASLVAACSIFIFQRWG